jgi:serine/threonine protein kinase
MISNLAVEGGKRLQSAVRAGEIVAGKYRVDAILGSGGNGVVVAARHVDLRTRVAIKFLGPEALKDDVAAARLLREARATARIPRGDQAMTDSGAAPVRPRSMPAAATKVS